MISFGFFYFIFGSVLGSFASLVGTRLLKEESILGRSRCDHCLHKLNPLDLIPLFSFIARKGKCRYCHHQIPYEYFFGEILGGWIFLFLMSDLIFVSLSITLVRIIAISMITTSLVGITVADLMEHLIPDELLLVLVIGVFGYVLPLSQTVFITHILISVIVFTIFFSIWWLTKGMGMGFGDVKLVTILGLWLGKEFIWIGIYLAFLLAAVVGIISIFKSGATLKSKIAFGPYLIIGSLLSWTFGSEIYRYYSMLF